MPNALDGVRLKIGEAYELMFDPVDQSVIIRPVANNRKKCTRALLLNITTSQTQEINKQWCLGSHYPVLTAVGNHKIDITISMSAMDQ